MGGMVAVNDHGTAAQLELEQQLWSVDQAEFRERLEAVKRRLSRKR